MNLCSGFLPSCTSERKRLTMCLVDNADDWEVLSDERPRAIKEHTCDDCFRVIGKGEHYRRVTGVSYNDLLTFKMCAHCEAAAAWLVRECRGYLFGGIHEDLREHWNIGGEYHQVWLARVLVGMRRKWARRDGSLMPVPSAPPKIAHAA